MIRTPVGGHGPSGWAPGTFVTRAEPEIQRSSRANGPWAPEMTSRVPDVRRQATWSNARVDLFHYRTKDKVEVDVILENRQGR